MKDSAARINVGKNIADHGEAIRFMVVASDDEETASRSTKMPVRVGCGRVCP